MPRPRLAVIGVGHLGKEHARILASLPEVELVGVADVNSEQAHAVARHVGTRAYTDYRPLLNLVDAATIAVPTTHHHAVAAEFLRRGLPVLIEKPLALNLEQADSLLELARRNGTWIQVGHIERFNPAFEELQKHPLQPKFVQCERLGPFSGRSGDIGVVMDLMIHDLDLLLTLVNSTVRTVAALGVSVLGKHEDVANARLVFDNGCVATVTASRVHPAPVRRMNVWAAEGYAGLDFAGGHVTLVQPSAELRRHGLDPRRLDSAGLARLKADLFGRYLQVLEVAVHQAEDQLTGELLDFTHCLREGGCPRVSGEAGREAIALASRILESIDHHLWEGQAGGPTGPCQLPVPLASLFRPAQGEVAA